MVSRSFRLLLVAGGAAILYLYGLSQAGLIGPDEPRYADIGRAMFETGDWVTPRLFGQPWFEKPALLYWMIGAGFAVGGDATLAPRLPVAILSLAFLAGYFLGLRRLLGERAATAATLILGTSVGWLGFSHAAVTDIPLTVFFGAGMLLALPWALDGNRRWLWLASACFGLASLSKGLVPLVLAAPLLTFGWRRVFDWLRPAPVAAFLAVSLPWYAFCYARNGAAFVNEFFWKHHVSRFFHADLQHVQPFWFYLPVLAGLLAPGTPLLLTLVRKDIWSDPRVRYFAAWAGFGLLFFSAATNKLPGYLLPLLPAVAALLGLALDRVPKAPVLLGATALLSGVYAIAGAALPDALSSGIRNADLSSIPWLWALPFLGAALLVGWLEQNAQRTGSLLVILALVVAGVGVLKHGTLGAVDNGVSARPIWREIEADPERYCIGDVHRATEYGLRYYSHGRIPLCTVETRPTPIHDPWPGASGSAALGQGGRQSGHSQ